MLSVAAALALSLSLVYALQGSDRAAAQDSDNGKDDIETVADAGNEVQGKSKASPKNEKSGQTMPQTGAPIERPLLFALVLLLDGTLALMVTQRKHRRAYLLN